MARGRPRKAGKRERNGRLQRDGSASLYDKGSERVQSMRERFGTYYNTALGRAYAGHLLGDEEQALNRYQAGRRFASLYTRIIGGDAYRCALDRTPRGAANDMEDSETIEREQRDQHWLLTAMEQLDASGNRPWFDQLISSLHTDQGPYWLDALLAGGKNPADTMILKAAIRALDIIAPEPTRQRIYAVTS